MAKSELVYEFLGSRNLNTTPIDITGLQGDKFDYELITFFEAEGANSGVDLQFNNDTAINYRYYQMQGDGSSANASNSDTEAKVTLSVYSYTNPSLIISKIAGSSGDERVIDILASLSRSSGDTRARGGWGSWSGTRRWSASPWP